MECSLSRDEGEFVEIKTYILKDRRSEINNQSFYPENLEQKHKDEPKSKKKEYNKDMQRNQ